MGKKKNKGGQTAYQFALDFEASLIPREGDKGARVVPPEVAEYERQLEELRRRNADPAARAREEEAKRLWLKHGQGGVPPEDDRWNPRYDRDADRALEGKRRRR